MTHLYNPARERLTRQIAKLTAARRLATAKKDSLAYSLLSLQAESNGHFTIAISLLEVAQSLHPVKGYTRRLLALRKSLPSVTLSFGGHAVTFPATSDRKDRENMIRRAEKYYGPLSPTEK